MVFFDEERYGMFYIDDGDLSFLISKVYFELENFRLKKPVNSKPVSTLAQVLEQLGDKGARKTSLKYFSLVDSLFERKGETREGEEIYSQIKNYAERLREFRSLSEKDIYELEEFCLSFSREVASRHIKDLRDNPSWSKFI